MNLTIGHQVQKESMTSTKFGDGQCAVNSSFSPESRKYQKKKPLSHGEVIFEIV
jgi:hypothetical protein